MMLQSTEREEGRKGFLDFRLFFSHKDTLDKKVDKKEGGGGRTRGESEEERESRRT